MGTDKLMNAFEAFKVKNLEEVKGGYYRVTWTNGSGLCDILNTETGVEYCNQADNYSAVGPA